MELIHNKAHITQTCESFADQFIGPIGKLSALPPAFRQYEGLATEVAMGVKLTRKLTWRSREIPGRSLRKKSGKLQISGKSLIVF